MLFLINPLFLVSFCCQKLVERQAAPRTEVIGWDRLESPSVNILLTTKLLSLDPLSWDMDCLLTLWPLLIPCSPGHGCCTFGFLIFIIVKFLVQQPIYTHRKIIKAPLLHQSLGPHVCLSFFLSLSLFHFLIIDSGPPGSGPLKDRNNYQNDSTIQDDLNIQSSPY